MRNIKEVDIFMFIKADSGNYVARLFYIPVWGQAPPSPGGQAPPFPGGQVPPSPEGRKLGVDLESALSAIFNIGWIQRKRWQYDYQRSK